MTVTQIQNKLERKRQAFSKVSSKYHAEIEALKSQLTGVCDHRQVKDYHYIWSNGFGRHDDCIGHECVHCGFKSPYRDGRFSDSSKWRSQWDDD